MSDIEYIYTDLPLNRLEYTAEEMIGRGQKMRYVSIDGSPAMGIKFSEVPPSRSRERWNIPFIDLRRYMITQGAVRFEYDKNDPWERSDRMSLDWLLNFIRSHFKSGARKFYYARLWEGFDPDEKSPKLKKIDLAKFEPSEKGFKFGFHTIWEFVDSSVKP